MNETKSAFNVKTVANRNSVSEGTIWGEIRRGELESLRIGDRRLITPEQEARWLERKAERERQRRAGEAQPKRPRLRQQPA
jgi:hypothetical protein